MHACAHVPRAGGGGMQFGVGHCEMPCVYSIRVVNVTLTQSLEVVNPDTQCCTYQYRHTHCHHNSHRKSNWSRWRRAFPLPLYVHVHAMYVHTWHAASSVWNTYIAWYTCMFACPLCPHSSGRATPHAWNNWHAIQSHAYDTYDAHAKSSSLHV